MTVELSELENLHNYVLGEIERLSKIPEADSSVLFDLRIADSNISLILLGASDETKTVNLGARDATVKNMLLKFRKKTDGQNFSPPCGKRYAYSAPVRLYHLRLLRS